MKLYIALSFMLLSFSGFAQEYFCTEWSEQNFTCVYGGRSAKVWARQCENVCTYRNYGPQCDLDRICLDQNPNDLQSTCSRWVKESGMSCVNPNSGQFQQKWVRACQKGLAMTWCSNVNPNRD